MCEDRPHHIRSYTSHASYIWAVSVHLVGSFSMMLLLSCLWLYVTLCARLEFSEINTAGNGGWSSFAPSLSCAEQTYLNPLILPQISSRLLWYGLQATSWRKGLKNKNRELWPHMNIVDVGEGEFFKGRGKCSFILPQLYENYSQYAGKFLS